MLESLDITVERVRAQVVRIVGSGEEVTPGRIPFTPRTKKVLELAWRESLGLGHNYIGTEHILLAIARENEGVAARILLDFDAESEKIRNEVIRSLSGSDGRPQDNPTETATAAVPLEVAVNRLKQELLKLSVRAIQGSKELARLRHARLELAVSTAHLDLIIAEVELAQDKS